MPKRVFAAIETSITLEKLLKTKTNYKIDIVTIKTVNLYPTISKVGDNKL